MNIDDLRAIGNQIVNIDATALSPFMHAAHKKIHGVDQYVVPENHRRAQLRAATNYTKPVALAEHQDKTPWDFSEICSTLLYWDQCFREVFLSHTTLNPKTLRSLVFGMRDLRNDIIHEPWTVTENMVLRLCITSEDVLRAAGANEAADDLKNIRMTKFREMPSQSLTVKHITDPEDIDLFAIWELQEREFADEIADNHHDMQRWIPEIDKNYAQDGDDKFDDIMLALKLLDDVVGYLYAQHYVNRQIIFISYLGYDENIREARHGKGPTELLKKLVQICQRSPRPPWKAIVAEVEQFKRGRSNHARDLFVKFRWYERGLQELLGTAGKLFILDFDYIQPAAKPIDIGKSPSDSQIQRLLLFARDVNSLDKTPTGNYVLPGDEAVKLFDAVISCVYGDAHRDDEGYQQYLRDTLASYRPHLESGVSLTDK
jgi:hypothetical protein